jgi:intracellular multiplication protein IcmE
MEPLSQSLQAEEHQVTVYSDWYTQTAAENDEADAALEADGGSNSPVLIVPAAQVLYARVITEASSREPSPVLAEIASGNLRGSRLIGSFSASDDRMILSFNRLVKPDGTTLNIDAVGIDPNTGRTGLASRVNHHYIRRYGLTMASEFISGMAEALSQPTTTNAVSSEGTITQIADPRTTEEAAYAGLSDAADEFSTQLQADAAKYSEPTVIIDQGALIGVLFLDAVIQQPGTATVVSTAGAAQ